MIHSVSDNKSNQDNVDVDDLIPYRMLRDRIEKHNEKVKKFLETSEKDSTNEISAEISGQIYPTTSSPSNPNKSKAEGGEKENDGEKLKLIDTSPRPLSLSSVSSSPSLILSPASEDKSGHSIPIFQSPRYSRQRHFSSSPAPFSFAPPSLFGKLIFRFPSLPARSFASSVMVALLFDFGML